MKTLVKMLSVLIILLPTLLHAEGNLEIDMDKFLTAKPRFPFLKSINIL